jgi:hypothetical protein
VHANHPAGSIAACNSVLVLILIFQFCVYPPLDYDLIDLRLQLNYLTLLVVLFLDNLPREYNIETASAESTCQIWNSFQHRIASFAALAAFFLSKIILLVLLHLNYGNLSSLCMWVFGAHKLKKFIKISENNHIYSFNYTLSMYKVLVLNS